VWESSQQPDLKPPCSKWMDITPLHIHSSLMNCSLVSHFLRLRILRFVHRKMLGLSPGIKTSILSQFCQKVDMCYQPSICSHVLQTSERHQLQWLCSLLLMCVYRAESVFQMMKSRFGIYNCHLLHINSSGSSVNDGTSAEHEALPNPWSRFVSRKHGLDVSTRLAHFFTGMTGSGFDSASSSEAVLGAEVLWALKMYISHYSDSSSCDFVRVSQNVSRQ